MTTIIEIFVYINFKYVCFHRPLRGFDLVKDRETGNSKGYAFCVYQVMLSTSFCLQLSENI